MSTEHVTREEIQKLDRRELAPAEFLAVARHLRECAECAPLARGEATPRVVLESAGVEDAPAHPDYESEIIPFVEGRLPRERHATIDEHLQTCDRCREDVADLSEERKRIRKHDPRRIYAVAAAAAAAFIASLFVMRVPREEPAGPQHV